MTIDRKRNALTAAAGAPVLDNQNVLTAGPRGPMLLQDICFLEKLAHFDREVIPERLMHAKGSGANETRIEALLDEALQETFPESDVVAIAVGPTSAVSASSRTMRSRRNHRRATMRKRLSETLVSLCAVLVAPMACAESFPAGDVFRPLIADPLEPRLFAAC